MYDYTWQHIKIAQSVGHYVKWKFTKLVSSPLRRNSYIRRTEAPQN